VLENRRIFFARLFFFSIAFLLAIAYPRASLQAELTLILNMEDRELLPEHFRSCTDPLHFSGLETLPNLKGLEELRASGSGQFSKKSLKALLQRLGNPLRCTVVDLRQESHGFINGMAVSWYSPKDWGNSGKTLDQIIRDEDARLKEALREQHVIIYQVLSKTPDDAIANKKAISTEVKSVATEKEVTTAASIEYIRIPVADHTRPSDVEVDQFVAFIRDLPANAWLHFHCAAGAGRTTTFMVMYDMARNAKQVSLEDILERQWLLGGIELSKLPNISHWKYDLAVDRIAFLKKFYNYCHDNRNGFRDSWSDYLRKKPNPSEI